MFSNDRLAVGSAILLVLSVGMNVPSTRANAGSVPSDRYRWVDELPRAVRKTAPTYPSANPKAPRAGTVILGATVDTAGIVRDITVEHSCPPFDSLAVSAVHKWLFTPARLNGKAVEAHVTIPVTFNAPGLKLQPTRRDRLLAAAHAAEKDRRWNDGLTL